MPANARDAASNIPIDAREVVDVHGLMTCVEDTQPEEFLRLCGVGSTWTVFIRTAVVEGKVVQRAPLGNFAETTCTCVQLQLNKPVPVEPGLRFAIRATADPRITAVGVVRPWDERTGFIRIRECDHGYGRNDHAH